MSRLISMLALMLASLTFSLADEAYAQDTSATGFVDQFVMELKGELEANAEPSSIATILGDYLAIDRMQKFMLSKRHREAADEADLTSFDSMFQPYIIAVYLDRVDDLVKRKLEFGDEIERKPGDFVVRSVLFDKDNDPRAKIDWRVLDVDGELKLVDVMVEGSSLNLDHRAQFSEIIKNDGFSSVLEYMQNTLAK